MEKLFVLVLLAFTFSAVGSEGATGFHNTFDSRFGAPIPVFHNNTPHKTGSVLCALLHPQDRSGGTVLANRKLIADDLPVFDPDKKDMPCHHGIGMKKCHHRGVFSLLSLSMPCQERCRMQTHNSNGTMSKSYDEGKLRQTQQLSKDVELVEFNLSPITPAIFTSLTEKVDSPPPRNIS